MSKFIKNLTRPNPNLTIPTIGVSTDKKLRTIGALAAAIIRLYMATLRVRWEGLQSAVQTQEDRGVVVAVWHRRLLVAAHLGRRYNIASMASRSRDGELIAQILTRLGLTMIRGSSFHGAVSGLKALLSLPKDCVIAITPDGPRGPVFSLQPGLIILAETTKRVILPMSWKAHRERRLRSWDSFALPLPFTRVLMRLGPMIDTQALSGDLEDKRRQVESIMQSFEEETQGMRM